jgi:hypothetical protein
LVTPKPKDVPTVLEWGNFDVTVGEPQRQSSVPSGTACRETVRAGGVFLNIPITIKNQGRTEEDFRASTLIFDAANKVFYPRRLNPCEDYLTVLAPDAQFERQGGSTRVQQQRIPAGTEVSRSLVFDVAADSINFTLVLWGIPKEIMLQLGR